MSGFSPINYALSKKLDSVILSGVISHSVDNVNKTITFTFNDGTSSTLQFDNPTNGVDGVGIATMYKDTNNHLIVSLTDGSTIDVGELPVGNATGIIKEITNITYLDSKLTFTFSDGTNRIVNIIPKLTELSDVSISTPTSGQVLVYNGATNKFINTNISTTDQYVKMTNADATGNYLADLIDNNTLVNNNNKLEVNKIKGQQITVDELNTLLGMDTNVKDTLNALATSGMIFKDVVPTKADLPQGALNGYVYIVNSDESDNGNRNAYIYADIHGGYVLIGSSGLEVRNFTNNPINLETEVSGILPSSKIDTTELVNKTSDIVSSLTYPIPDSDLNKIADLNVLKQINTEVGNALNNKVDKSVITTVLDNSVTDNQIPSAKVVYDKVNSVAVSQIVTSFDSETIEDYLERLTPNVDVVFVSNFTTGELVTLTKEHLFMIEYRKIGTYLYLQRAYQAKDGKLIACRSKNWWNDNWGKWQKVCTTNVADVPKTTITLSDEKYIKNRVDSPFYEVVNGVCYIWFDFALVKSTNAFVTIASQIPKSKYETNLSLVDRNGNGKAIITVNTNGTLWIFPQGTEGTSSYRGMFSYPVAE